MPSKRTYLSELLPYDPKQKKHPELKKALLEYQFLLTSASIALQHLQNLDLEKFDSLVGENACQIRAIKIALIASSQNLVQFENLMERIASALEIIEVLIEDASIISFMQKKYTLSTLLVNNRIDVLLTFDEMFLIQSYLLCEMKECQIDNEFISSFLRIEKCSRSALQKKHPQVSYCFIDKLSKKLRLLLSEASVVFIRSMSSDLHDSITKKMVSKEFELHHNKLLCIPTFWTFKALIALSSSKKIPFIIHAKFLKELAEGYQVIDEDFLYFKPGENGAYCFVAEPTEKDLFMPACIVQGLVAPKEGRPVFSKLQWRTLMAKHSIQDVLLAIGADHRQYPGLNQGNPTQNFEFNKYKYFAGKMGFSLNNPTTFFAQHIYCSLGSNLIPSYAELTAANQASNH